MVETHSTRRVGPADLGAAGGTARRLLASQPADPVFCLRPHAVTRAARWFADAFPGETFYAVKANPEPWAVQAVWDGGVRAFDVASLAEVRAVRARLPEARLAYMHPIKPEAAIREAYAAHGVRVFALDHADELAKIVRATDGARDLTLVVRLRVPSGEAGIPLGAKFGANPAEAARLLAASRREAHRLGLAFHVGSQQTDPAAWGRAMDTAQRAVVEAGVILDVLDIGGGFPAPYPGQPHTDLAGIAARIERRFEPFLSAENSALWCEPGRALVAEGASLVVRVEARRGDVLHVSDGTYGALYDAGALGWRYPVRNLNRDGEGPIRAFALYGPTCDDADFMPGPFDLPADTAAGDLIEVGQLGAYGRCMATGFNGFGTYRELLCTDDPFGTAYEENQTIRRAAR